MLRVLIFLFLIISLNATEKIDREFLEKREKLKAEYRVKFSKILLTADKVEISIVKFDGINEGEDPFAEEDQFIEDGQEIKVFDSQQTFILQKKVLEAAEKEQILNLVAQQIAKQEQGGGALCHFPIHGLRVYKKDKLIYEATFCWVCGNFGFHYPTGSDYLGINQEMEKAFKKIMPIPQSEIDRFKKKYGNLKSK